MPATEQSERYTLFLGSLPFPSTESAMEEIMRRFGGSLYSLPDGECGEYAFSGAERSIRSNWITSAWWYMQETLAKERGLFRVVRPLDLDPREGVVTKPVPPQFKPTFRPHPDAVPDGLEFGYRSAFAQSYPAFLALREQWAQQDQCMGSIKFQIGVPTPLALTLLALPGLDKLRYLQVFQAALARECNAIIRQAGRENCILQIEVPMEANLAAKLPPLADRWLCKSVTNLASLLDAGTCVGVHVCMGDHNHQAMTPLTRLPRVISFVNRFASARYWPAGRQLSYVHLGLAEGAIPPSTDHDRYAALSELRLPQGTRFVAGFIHEGRTVEELLAIRGLVEHSVGNRVDMAYSCGLGRLKYEVAQAVLKKTELLLAAS